MARLTAPLKGVTLTLVFECPEGARLRLGPVTLQGITLGQHYLDQVGASLNDRHSPLELRIALPEALLAHGLGTQAAP